MYNEDYGIFNECQFINEGVFVSAISKHLDKLKDLRKTAPDKYTENKKVCDYVEKNYDKIIKYADIMENKEPKNINKNTFAYVATAIAGILASLSGGIGATCVIAYVSTVVLNLLSVIRKSHNSDALVCLGSIKKSLKSVDKSKLDKNTAIKVDRLISSIDDAKTRYEISGNKIIDTTL